MNKEEEVALKLAAQRKRKTLLLATLLTTIVLGTSILAGIVFMRSRQVSQTNPILNLKTHNVDGVTIRANITDDNAAQIVSFIKKAVQKSLLPTDIAFQFADRGNQARGDSYATAWNKDGKFISLLYGLTTDGKKISYIRIWIMPPGETVDTKEATSLLSDVFDKDFLASVGNADCAQTKDPTSQADSTECAKLMTNSTGDLEGVTVRAPVTLQPPPGSPPSAPGPKVIIVSACHVPKEGTQFYTRSVCI